jgi:putrescine transport system ATP-binding protein
VAIRPEKLRLERTPPAPPLNGLPGMVEEIAYLGNQSIYRVILDGGRRIDVMKANVDRAEEDAVTWDERVFVTFSPRAGIALTG